MKTAQEYATEAREWADQLVLRKYQGPGQMARAFDRASNAVGVDRGFLWMLRYRFSEQQFSVVEAYFRLKADYDAECERQERLLSAERQITRDIEDAISKGDDSAPD